MTSYQIYKKYWKKDGSIGVRPEFAKLTGTQYEGLRKKRFKKGEKTKVVFLNTVEDAMKEPNPTKKISNYKVPRSVKIIISKILNEKPVSKEEVNSLKNLKLKQLEGSQWQALLPVILSALPALLGKGYVSNDQRAMIEKIIDQQKMGGLLRLPFKGGKKTKKFREEIVGETLEKAKEISTRGLRQLGPRRITLQEGKKKKA